MDENKIIGKANKWRKLGKSENWKKLNRERRKISPKERRKIGWKKGIKNIGRNERKEENT